MAENSAKSNRSLGRAGESVACDFLVKNGFSIVKRNYTVRGGEIDIIAENGDCIAFVEVKTRHTGSLVSGFEAVTASKQRFIIRTAEAYLLRNGSELQPRFDVAAVEYDGERICGIDYIENAFDASR